MKEIRQIVSILFSDIVGYSSIEDDRLYTKVNEFLTKTLNHLIGELNYIYYNTWGDALYLCTYDPLEMAEFALKWRDIFLNTNWKKMGLHDHLTIRIALHTEKCQIIREKSKIVNVLGKNVNAAARIEPVVESNQIYCSELFYKTIISDENLNFKFYSLGKQKLAKEYGEMELYIMLRQYESYEKSTVSSDTTYDIPESQIIEEFKQLANEWASSNYPYYIIETLNNKKISFVRHPVPDFELDDYNILSLLMASSLHFGGNWYFWIKKNLKNPEILNILFRLLNVGYDRVKFRIFYSLQLIEGDLLKQTIEKSNEYLTAYTKSVLLKYVLTGNVVN